MVRKIEALCRTCDADTKHSIISVDDKKNKIVKCDICKSTHNYEKSIKTILKEIEKLPNYKPPKEQNKEKVDPIVEYKINKNYEISTKIKHKKFGMGVVKRVINNKTIMVKFNDRIIKLVQNYRD